MTIFRPAQETDLAAIYEVFYQNEILDSPHPPSRGNIPPYLRHVLQTGTLYVAEQDGLVLAYAGAITRGNISFLTDVFVRPTQQSGQLGKTLLHSVLPQDGLIHY
ncbi:MAG: GNAT family N-acetyltransferase, partial [Ktedonobacteraceae bacterium]